MASAPIYVLTSDKYLDALRPFAWLMLKYWNPPPQVIVGGFTKPKFSLPPNFTFHSLGGFASFPLKKWSNALIKFLMVQPYEVFGLMLEDYWLTRKVDVEAIDIAAAYMEQFHYVARFDLTGDRKNSGFAKQYGTAGKVRLVISDPDSQYHCSLMCALWRKEHLLRILVEDESPWEVELNGTPRLRELRDQCIVLGTEDPPLHHTLAFRSGNPGHLLLDELKPEDVQEMSELGLLAPWGT